MNLAKDSLAKFGYKQAKHGKVYFSFLPFCDVVELGSGDDRIVQPNLVGYKQDMKIKKKV